MSPMDAPGQDSFVPFKRVRQALVHRLDLLEQLAMLNTQPLQFVGEIKRRQYRQVDRVDRPRARPDQPASLVHRARYRPHPVSVRIAGHFQALPHYLDADVRHAPYAKSSPSNRANSFSIRVLTST